MNYSCPYLKICIYCVVRKNWKFWTCSDCPFFSQSSKRRKRVLLWKLSPTRPLNKKDGVSLTITARAIINALTGPRLIGGCFGRVPTAPTNPKSHCCVKIPLLVVSNQKAPRSTQNARALKFQTFRLTTSPLCWESGACLFYSILHLVGEPSYSKTQIAAMRID